MLLLSSRSYAEALPTELPDEWLEKLGRDLRQIEAPYTSEAGTGAELACAMYLISHLCLQRSGLQVARWDLSEFGKLLEALQYLIEREIVGRAVGVRIPSDAKAFTALVDSLIASAQGAANDQ
jgi:hypothetical protein